MVKVQVKWEKQTFDLDVDPSVGVEVVQAQLFALTNVPVERQKLLNKGKMLKTNDDLAKLTDGTKLMLMGTANVIADQPQTKVLFEEDLTIEQKNELTPMSIQKAGLNNLGNTCYMNSSLQVLRAVPELSTALKEYAKKNPPNSSQDLSHRLTSYLGQLFSNLDASEKPIPPMLFSEVFRMAFPQFNQRNDKGQLMQQDADEAMMQLMTAVSAQLKAQAAAPAAGGAAPQALSPTSVENKIDDLFGGEMEQVLKCDESPNEAPVHTKDHFRKLRCHIDINTNFLHDGLLKGLEEKIEKNAPSLGRNANFTRTSSISRLPKYMLVQFVRFFWRADTNVKAKILRKVTFPMVLDAMPYCSESLKKSLSNKRQARSEAEAAKLGLPPLKGPDAKPDDSKAAPAPAPTPAASSDGPAPMDIDTDSAAKLGTYGFYELIGVVTHQGRSADGGHYIGWVKSSNTEWLRYDDDNVTTVKADEIPNLSGGGDWHMAYLLIYRQRSDEDEAALAAVPKPKKVLSNS